MPYVSKPLGKHAIRWFLIFWADDRHQVLTTTAKIRIATNLPDWLLIRFGEFLLLLLLMLLLGAVALAVAVAFAFAVAV